VILSFLKVSTISGLLYGMVLSVSIVRSNNIIIIIGGGGGGGISSNRSSSFFLEVTYSITTESFCIRFVGYNLKVSHHRHVYN
jgi:hypothetical protein